MNCSTRKRFALCIDNDDFKASLIVGKVYRILPDAKGAPDQLIRIVDESGEDYLYPESLFLSVAFPRSVERKLLSLQAAP
jgi:hypothetical protein